jgi:hypothetical protein
MIAKWDGTNWCSLGSHVNSIVYGIEEYNSDIYMAGGFDSIGVVGDPYYMMLAKWTGGTYVDTCGHLLTGINEAQTNNETLSIYPNPAINQIIIEFDVAETKNNLIEIKNVLGQTVKTINNIASSKGINKIEIDVSEFSNGLYFVQLFNNNKLVSTKFIKQ